MKEKILLIIVMSLLFIGKLYSQVPPPPEFEEHAPAPGTVPTPIDQISFILILFGAGLAFVYFITKNKKNYI